MSVVTRILSVFRSVAIVIAIALVFLFGVATTVYLSLRSPEVTVPDVVGKNRFEAEKILADADLKFRVRATRPSTEAQPDTVMFQLPRAGEVVKTGQTVAMDISRLAKAGESSEKVTPDEPVENRNTNSSANNNENKPKRPRPRNTNENANANGNTNGNTNKSINANRANANRTNTNTGAINANATPRSNVTRPDQKNANTRPAAVNSNRPVPRPTPKPN
ncbi:MAG TPA: PASTA domain-containing protein [Pyrinomonadaceae bacterium]|nr:PASTA domain-containing protein [Pyrinomonadaceae bacterium]